MIKNKIEDYKESIIGKPKDSESDDNKFNKEMENRFTDLMYRARSNVVDEYRKNNSHLYSMTTCHNNNEITVIQADMSVLCDFEEKCNRIANEIGLKQFRIYKHKDDSDISGIQICEVYPLRGEFNRYIEKSLKSMLDCCDCIKDHFKNYVEIKKSCDDIRSRIIDLRNMVETEYTHSIDSHLTQVYPEPSNDYSLEDLKQPDECHNNDLHICPIYGVMMSHAVKRSN